MSREVECRTVMPGLGCRATISGESDEEILRLATEHARSAHSVEADTVFANKVKWNTRDTETKSG